MLKISKNTMAPNKPLSFREILVFVLVFLSLATYVVARSFAATPNAVPGDINGDGTVNITDLSILLSNYNKTPATASNPNSDINGDNIINIFDLSILLSNYGATGSSCSPSFSSFGYINGTLTSPPACWRPYADTSPYNQQLPDPSLTTLDPNSANIVNFINTAYGSSGFSNLDISNTPANDTASNWDHPLYWAHTGDPSYAINDNLYGCGTSACPSSVLIPSGAQRALNGDGHLAVVQPDGTEIDFWQVQNANPLTSGGTLTVHAHGSIPITGSGCCGNSTAALQGLAAGLIRGQELQQGVINHALIINVKCDSGGHVYPAAGNGAACASRTNAPAEGQRFQLNMTDAQVIALSIPDYRKIILKAMIHYGFYITDTGGSPWDLHFEPAIDSTSFGAPNPLITYVKSAGLTTANTYTLTFNSGVDWSKLQVVNVCYTQGTCQ
jgi:hypothetical protein